MKTLNLIKNLPEGLQNELFTTLAATPSMKIERIVSEGHRTPDGEWYDQEWPEWVLLIQGEAHLEFEGEPEHVSMKPMDHILIQAHRRHRVVWTAPDQKTLWLAVHFSASENS